MAAPSTTPLAEGAAPKFAAAYLFKKPGVGRSVNRRYNWYNGCLRHDTAAASEDKVVEDGQGYQVDEVYYDTYARG